MFQYRSDQPQVKRNVIPSIANLVQELPHELPNDLRVRILGNIEILGKPQIWVETQRSAQTPFQKLNFGVTAKKHTEVDIQLFLSFPDLLDFSILFQMSCLGLSEQTKFWSEPCPVSFKRHFFFIVCISSEHFSKLQGKYKAGSQYYPFKINGFVQAIFCIFCLGQKLTLERFHRYLLIVY